MILANDILHGTGTHRTSKDRPLSLCLMSVTSHMSHKFKAGDGITEYCSLENHTQHPYFTKL